MTFRISFEADEDVNRAYIEGAIRYGVEQAERYQDGLFDTFALLATQPRLARLRDDYRAAGPAAPVPGAYDHLCRG